MKKKVLSLLSPMIILIIGGGLFLFKKVSLLYLENMDHPKTIKIRVDPTKNLSIFYTHSIYKEPVVEEFLIEKGSIVLKGIKTKSPAVIEYYGFEDFKETQTLNRRLGEVFIMRRGMGEENGLLIKDRKIYLHEMANRGDRIRLKVETINLGRYILMKLKKKGS